MVTPKELRATLHAAVDLMEEAATNPDQRAQARQARFEANTFRGFPVAAHLAWFEAMHMNGRKRRIKRWLVSLG